CERGYCTGSSGQILVGCVKVTCVPIYDNSLPRTIKRQCDRRPACGAGRVAICTNQGNCARTLHGPLVNCCLTYSCVRRLYPRRLHGLPLTTRRAEEWKTSLSDHRFMAVVVPAFVDSAPASARAPTAEEFKFDPAKLSWRVFWRADLGFSVELPGEPEITVDET